VIGTLTTHNGKARYLVTDARTGLIKKRLVVQVAGTAASARYRSASLAAWEPAWEPPGRTTSQAYGRE
jgi:hypothetical protein